MASRLRGNSIIMTNNEWLLRYFIFLFLTLKQCYLSSLFNHREADHIIKKQHSDLEGVRDNFYAIFKALSSSHGS